jgi:hypothetical protein
MHYLALKVVYYEHCIGLYTMFFLLILASITVVVQPHPLRYLQYILVLYCTLLLLLLLNLRLTIVAVRERNPPVYFWPDFSAFRPFHRFDAGESTRELTVEPVPCHCPLIPPTQQPIAAATAAAASLTASSQHLRSSSLAAEPQFVRALTPATWAASIPYSYDG